MFVLNLVFLAYLATAAAQSGIPRYIQGQWIVSDESPQYEDVLAAEGHTAWPQNPPELVELVTEDQTLLTTLEPNTIKEQVSDEESAEGQDLAVWKISLVAAILLVSIVGSLSVAYYMCIWRGGRIHYQPQKGAYP